MNKKLTSFNEDIEILFDEEKHKYLHGKKRLKSATGFVKDYESSFDKERISGICSDNWGIPQKDILAMWDSNGNAAAMFGTSIHAVMEHYYTYKEIGAEIQEVAQKEKNAAMPNHPFLQILIAELDEIRVDGETEQEALISAHKKGVCGLVDDLLIVDRKKKICRIRDYKITFDLLVDKTKLKEPFGYLGSSKLSKNFLQLSFYGCMMLLSDWTVEGVDIYNWDGSWSKHTLEGPELMKTMLLIGSKLDK